MIFDRPVSFVEAVRHLVAKGLMPTGLDSAGIRQLDAALRRQSFFSAETMSTDLLGRYKEMVTSIVDPQQVMREGATQTVTEGYDPASARLAIKQFLAEQGYAPGEDIAGTVKDLSSDKRINLVVKTNVQLAHGAGRFVQQNSDADVVELWPALELVRFESRDVPRDWKQRWRIAAQVSGDAKAFACMELQGRMAALKSSGIWQALGDGEGGYDDTLGNPYPPFAFNSGMWTEEVSRDEAIELGLLQEGEIGGAAEFDLSSLFGEAA